MAGTRIASVSGLRGVVGDGLDPAVAVEFAAAYASRCEPGADRGRARRPGLGPGVRAGRAGRGHGDRARRPAAPGAAATPTDRPAGPRPEAAGGIQISASHNPPEYNGLKFFQPRGWSSSPARGPGHARPLAAQEFGWAAWDAPGQVANARRPRRRPTCDRCSRSSTSRRSAAASSWSCSTPATGPGAGWRAALLRGPGLRAGRPGGRARRPLRPPARADRGEPADVLGDRPRRRAPRSGFAQDPDADRLAIVDETGRYIGEELTLALAAASGGLTRRRGPVVLNLSTSRVTEDLAAPGRLPGDPDAGRRDQRRRGDAGRGGRPRRRGERRRDRPPGRVRPRQLRRHGPGPRPAGRRGRPLSSWSTTLPRFAMVKDQYPLAAGTLDPDEVAALWDRIAARLSRGEGRPPRRAPARLARPLGARPVEQHRADRPGDRRGGRASADRPRAGRRDRPLGRRTRERSDEQTAGPPSSRPPAVAFVDVDGTLLAETTTFLFARILRRRGLIRRSFMLRALYHGLQHRFGRLDYGRLVAFGLKSIARIPVVELERIAYENFVEYVRPRLYEGVVEHLNALRRSGTPIVLVSSSPGIVIEPLSLYLGCTDTLTTPVVIERNRLVGIGHGPPCYGEGKLYWAEQWAEEQEIAMDERSPMRIIGAIGPCWSRSAGPWSSTPREAAPTGPRARLGRRPAVKTRPAPGSTPWPPEAPSVRSNLKMI